MLQVFSEIRTKDGLELELESIKSMLAALDRYFIGHVCKYSIIRDREFYQSGRMPVLEEAKTMDYLTNHNMITMAMSICKTFKLAA